MTAAPSAGPRTRLTEAFGLTCPVISAPMALVSGGRLAAAVSAAGGLGLIGGGYAGTLGAEPDLQAQFDLAGNQPVGIGFITWALDQAPERLDDVLARRPACVFLSFGDPRPYAAKIASAGARLICQVQTLAQIDPALEAGATAIVVQGTEAGGHGGDRGLMAFLPEAADYLAARSPQTLLLGAGGIADGRGLAAALMLGADGVVVGSRFWAAAESLAPAGAVDLAVNRTGDGTRRLRAIDALRGVPWPADYSFRVLRNPLTETWAGRDHEAQSAFGSLKADYDRARAQNDLDVVVAVAGEAVGLIHDRPTAREIIAEMSRTASGLLAGGASRL